MTLKTKEDQLMASLRERLRKSWNVFIGKDNAPYMNYGPSYSRRPDRSRTLYGGTKQSIVSSVTSHIAIDCAAVNVLHARVDGNHRYVETIDDDLNKIFTLEANLDQTGREFKQDIVQSMFDEGSVAVVPVETSDKIDENSGSYKIYTMRVGKIVAWYPQHVKVDLYDERIGQHKQITLPKREVAIVENPLYSIMNEPNSILQRLIRKMSLLDNIDEISGSGKLDLIFQLPYSVKTETKRREAAKRKADIEKQLYESKYGIAYIDATEKVTQLNRSIENNLLAQIQYLQKLFYNQLGATEEVFDGTATEAVMLNYYNRTIEPILAAFVDEFNRKFISDTARSQGQAIIYYREPFKLVPVDKLADIADKFTRNEILSSNEVRAIVGFKPIDDPRADELRNKNINESAEVLPPANTNQADYPPEEGQYLDHSAIYNILLRSRKEKIQNGTKKL